MKDSLSTNDELVITNTNITHTQSKEFNVDVADLETATLISDKSEIETDGIFYILPHNHKTHKIKGYTASYHTQKSAYDSLTDDQRVACFWDGYKRRMINSPDGVTFKASLGVVEKTAKIKAQDASYERAIAKGVDEKTARIIAYGK